MANNSYIRFLAEEKAAENKKKFDALTKELHKNRAAFDRAIKAWWSRPLAAIQAEGCPEASYDVLDLLADPTQDSYASTRLYQEFVRELPQRLGYTLNAAGELRFREYVKSQVLRGEVALTTASLTTIFERTVSLDIYDLNTGELGFDETLIPPTPPPAPEPQREPTLADLEALPPTREGDREAHRIVEEMANAECVPLAMEFIAHVKSHFGYDFTYEDGRAFKRYCDRFNKAQWDRRTYDSFRLAQVSSGAWPDSLLTEQEKNAREFEKVGDLGNYENRQRALRLLGR